MKKVFIISLSLLSLGACTKDITSYNEQTKRAATVPAETLFTNALRNMTDATASANVNLNVFRYTVQHWAATTYQDEPNYDFVTRAIPDALWTRFYRDVLADLANAKSIIQEDALLSDAVKANKLATCDIVQVYAYHLLVTTFGNVPYTEALDYNNTFPAYDDAKTVYDDLITRLTADIAALDDSEAGISSTQDLLYGGDVAAWKKFGNSLMLRMAMVIADSDGAKAKSLFEAANAGAFSSSDDDAIFAYLATTPNTNPIWVDLVQSGRQDVIAGKPLMDKMLDMDDPRLNLYFRPNNNGDYVGGIVGSNNTFANFAKPSEEITAPDFPAILIDYTEVEFLRAEAAERGFSVTGSAASHYNNAISASVESWGGAPADAATYLARTDVAYATATGNWKQKIGFQKWIGLYNRPFEGWLEVRRLDQPVLAPPSNPEPGGFPVRLTYSQAEQQLNPDSYTSAASAIGGDAVGTKLFWDKF